MLKRSSIAAGVALLGLLAAAAPVRAEGFQTFLGNTSVGSAFDRPNASCEADADTDSVQFIAQRFALSSAARCFIYSAQHYDGFIHLYGGSFNPALPLLGCLEGDDDGDLGQGTSQLDALDLPAGSYVLVTSAFETGLSGAFSNTIHCGTGSGTNPRVSNVQPFHGACPSVFPGVPDDREICLHNKYKVAIDNISGPAPGGVATPVRTGSSDTGLFWFYNDRNWEVMVKVLRGCPINGHWWVFIGALTDQRYTVRVADVGAPLAVKSYSNQLGDRAAAVADTEAFPCAPGD